MFHSPCSLYAPNFELEYCCRLQAHFALLAGTTQIFQNIQNLWTDAVLRRSINSSQGLFCLCKVSFLCEKQLRKLIRESDP